MLAIIIPFYKLTFFEATLQSLANQTVNRFKVYIGDDASPENPIELLEKYKGRFDFVYHRFDENLGGSSLTKQWDLCIALSVNEDWIMILGDDDVLGDNVVEEFYRNIDEINTNRSNVIKFATQSYDVSNDKMSKKYQHPKLEDAAGFYFKRFKGEVRSSLSEHIFKREGYVKYGFKNYPLAWHSDDFAWLEFAEKKPIYCINEAVMTITVSNGSISGNRKNLDFKNLAESAFFMDVVNDKLLLFSKAQRLELLYQAEVSLKKNRNPSYEEWSRLAKEYIYNFSPIPAIKFARRIVKQVIR